MLYRRLSASAALALLSLLALPVSQAKAAEEPGLVGEYYLVKSPGGFPSIEGKTPFLVRVDKQVNFGQSSGDFYKTKLSENFFVVWTGMLRVETAGEYTLGVAVDDAARISIDDKVIVQAVTSNGIAEKSGTVELTAGEHPIKIEFLQKGGGAACMVSWTAPGGKKQPVPASALAHDKSAEAVKWDKAAWEKARGPGGGPTSWDALDYGPFLSASILASQPADNLTYKGVAVKLGKVKSNGQEVDASVCFDTQLMRMSAGWTGGFLNLRNVAFTGDHGPCPTVAGDQKFGTHNSPAWAQKDGSFTDPRMALHGEPFGGMPREYLHYKGLYRHGEQVVFSYTVNGMDVLETPGVKQVGDNVVFTRTFEVGPSTLTQKTIVAASESPSQAHDGSVTNFASIASENSATSVTVRGDVTTLETSAGDKKLPAAIRVVIPPHEKKQRFTVFICNRADLNLGDDAEKLKDEATDLGLLTKGGPAHWSQELSAVGQLQVEPKAKAAGAKQGKDSGGAENAAYVLDEIGLPEIPSNWPRLRFGGFDFFPDGKSAALCTWNGDVYVVKGIDEKLDHLTWRRVAGGMFQTLGLKIIDGNIYVHGRDQITILHDLDGDGEADFYENFNNDVAITDHFHEFAFDLQQDKEGNLYIIKGGGVNPGGGGFQRPIVRNHGTLMKISKDGTKLEVIATGFRAPNGMCVREDGQAVTGDNQGSWTPVDRLNWIKPGMFCGVPDLSHKTPEPVITDSPLCWFIYPGWDNSCGDPVFVSSDKWGQPRGDLFYLSYGQTTLMHILPEEVDGVMQGGAVRFPWHFSTGSMRARFNPADGQLYVCGFLGWQTNAKKATAFERVRFTGKKSYQPTGLHVKDNGIEITFAEPLKKESAEDAGAWAIEQWNYRWTNSYGSKEFKTSNPNENGHDPLDVKSVKLSADGKTVFLEVADLQPVMQMLIRGNAIEAADGTPVNVEIANTINAVKGKKLVIEVGKVEAK